MIHESYKTYDIMENKTEFTVKWSNVLDTHTHTYTYTVYTHTYIYI